MNWSTGICECGQMAMEVYKYPDGETKPICTECLRKKNELTNNINSNQNVNGLDMIIIQIASCKICGSLICPELQTTCLNGCERKKPEFYSIHKHLNIRIPVHEAMKFVVKF